MTPAVAVVIPTFRRPGLLAKCLAAVMDQDLNPGAFEVIVVDDEPSDETRRVVELYATAAVSAESPRPAAPFRTGERGPTVRYVPMHETHGPAAARNAGWRAARSPVIAFTDDDCLPEPGWLRWGLHAIQSGADGASGQLIVPRPDPPSDYEAMIGRLEQSPFVTANCFYRRDAIDASGGFDERFRVAWREDSDLHFRMLKAGHRLIHAPEARVVHPVREAPWGISLREQRKSQYNALLYRKHPREYRSNVQPRPPIRYYATLITLALAVASIVSGRRRLGGTAAVAWFAQTTVFCLHRLNGTRHDPGHVVEMAATSVLIPPLSVFWRLRGAVRFRTFFM